MSLKKKDFYGKEVTEAIRKACEDLNEAQENLDIEVVETGSTGIFGLIRKKAHIRVQVKPKLDEDEEDEPEVEVNEISEEETAELIKKASAATELVAEWPFDEDDATDDPVEISTLGGQKIEGLPIVEEEEPDGEGDVSSEAVACINDELLKIVELMGFASTLDIETKGMSVACTLRSEFEDEIAGVDGKVLDSLQYILRKVVGRKVEERVRISLNVGDFRERRLESLKVRAVELATQVKEDGKTQVLPALNPSERRAIHMILQEDKEIRSRSVGDGLFKKILIYKPGKGNRGGRRRSNNKGRQGKAGQNQKQRKSS